MAHESSFESPNGNSNHECEDCQPGDLGGALEHEWHEISTAYGNQETATEGDAPKTTATQKNRPLPLKDRDARIARTHQIIRACRQIASPVAQEILALPEALREAPRAMFSMERLLAEHESFTTAASNETAALESQSLGESEFNAELQNTEQAQDLALTEVLAAEATHAEMESEAQALLGTTLPINISLITKGTDITKALPALTQANSRLVGSLFHSGPLAREALALVPTIQRRTIAGLKALQQQQAPLSLQRINRMFAAQTAQVLNSPSTIGKAVIRNLAIRSNTMPACPQGPAR